MPNSNIDELSLYRSGGGVNGKTLSLNRSGKPNLDIDEVKLYLGGWGLSPGMEVTHNIKSYSINYDMFGRGGTFECSLMADNEFIVAIFGPTMLISLSQAPILFRWVINGHNWMSGFLDKKEVQYDNNGLSVTVYGRDYMQILTDNTILFPRTVPDPQLPSSLKYLAGNTSKSLPELIMGYWLENSYVPEVTNYNPDGSVTTRPLTKNLDITAYLDPEPFRYTTTAIKILQERMPVFYKISADVGESLFDLFSRLCNQIGLFMFNPPGTNYIVIHAAIP